MIVSELALLVGAIAKTDPTRRVVDSHGTSIRVREYHYLEDANGIYVDEGFEPFTDIPDGHIDRTVLMIG